MDEVAVKGWRNGLLLVLPDKGSWEKALLELESKLDAANTRTFWRDAQTTLDVGGRVLTTAEIDACAHRLKRAYGVVPVAVVATDAATRDAAQKIALTVYDVLPTIKKPFAPVAVAAEETPQPVSASSATLHENNALYVQQMVRSGRRIVSNGHLIVCGDVNSGAELVAAGDIVVFGTLRGVAHAGCFGDETAKIVAMSLRPPQLRIATKIARSPDQAGAVGAASNATPEVARIEDGEIQVYPF